MAKSLPIDYIPEPTPYTPDDIPRYLEQELNKIREALIAQAVALAVNESGTETVTTVPNWQFLFIGQTPTWDVPGGNFDPTTGFWTCPQSGLYSINASMEVQPFGLGNKFYYAGIRVYRDRGGVITYEESTDGGDDAVPLGVTIAIMVPLQQGDILGVESTIVHDQFVGDVDYTARWQIKRESA